MRVVLKPAGLVFVLLGMGLLGFLAYRNLTGEGRKDSGSRSSGTGGSGSVSKAADTSLIGDGISGFTTPSTELGTMTVVPAEGVPGSGGAAKALRLTVTGKPKVRWDVQAGHDNIAPLSEHQALTLSFWARSPNSSQAAVVFEQAKAPFAKALDKEMKLTPAWKPYRFDFNTPAYPTGGAAVRFHVGYASGNVVEVAGVRLEPTSTIHGGASSAASPSSSPR